MIHRRFALMVVLASLVAAACSSDPPPPPAPEGPSEAELAQMRTDSIAAANEQAERERLAAEEATRRAEEAAERAVREAREALTEMVFFDYDESAITSAGESVLRAKVDILRNSPAVNLRMEGHADERGSTEYNMALGNRRAESVRQFLAGFGLEGSRFETVSFGEERPLQNRSDESAWTQNRRVEFVITAGEDEVKAGAEDR